MDQHFLRAAELIDQADGLLITAGAGMGVNSGLPDFRGAEGFWKAYPALAKAGIHFQTIASPASFRTNPRMAWGFYGHRLNLYRRTLPHDGFRILLELADSMPRGAFVFTSNVDGQFQKAGFRDSEVCEVHGSIHHLQCLDGCTGDIWSTRGFDPIVDEEQCRLTSDLPACPHCGGLARPNILMFGDSGWLEFRERIQDAALRQWLRRVERPVVIELGAGTSIPTVRIVGQQVDSPMIRINLRESQVARKADIGLAVGALEGLQCIAVALKGMSSDVAERCERRYDDWGQSNNQVKLPESVVAKILELIRQENVGSISCPYDDPDLWLALVAEQVRRAAASGLPPQDAFTLCGPDGGLWDTPVEALGGYVHIPYEGLCGGDLLIWPKGRRFRVRQGTTTGKLRVAATVSGCYYLLSPEDFGEVSFATRTLVGVWALYQSNAPFEPCDVFGVKELEEIKKSIAARNEGLV